MPSQTSELILDRTEIDDDPTDPVRIAQVIRSQLPSGRLRVDVNAIAYALDIRNIVYQPSLSFDGALVTTADRNDGNILINESLRWHRRRYSIAHELGHYLLVNHGTTQAHGLYFECAKSDMSENWVNSVDQVHRRQEAEANLFAIELLAPRQLAAARIAPDKGLQNILELAAVFDISKVAAARRYIDVTPAPQAIGILQDGVVAYSLSSKTMPPINLRRGTRVENLPTHPSRRLTSVRLDAPTQWLVNPDSRVVSTQVLRQEGGYGMVMLSLN